MLFTDSLLYDFIGIFTALIVIVVAYYKWTFSYWKQKGFDGPEPSIPFGHAGDFVFGKQHFGEIWKDIYFYAKDKGLRYGIGFFFASPSIVPVDLDLVKHIVQNDFPHFWGKGIFVNEEVDPLSANLFNLEGPKWKSIRTRLTPTFTSGKMKMMFHILVETANHLQTILEGYSKEKKAVELKDTFGRFTTDVIGSCAFGLECNCLENPDSEFRYFGLRTIKTDLAETLWNIMQVVLPEWFLRLIKFHPSDRPAAEFFSNIVRSTVAYRENNNVTRKDFMDLLIQLKNKGHFDDSSAGEGGALTLDEIAAQVFIFFIAGFETSSTTIHGAAYELAVNPDVQGKLREEINSVLENNGNILSYDAIAEMKYLDKVVSETLRKYPPVPMLNRQCNKEYIIPGTDTIIPNGTPVIIPVLGIHHDPEYYPNPEKFEPDRFTEANKASRPSMAWIPFGEGPRICIGMRFGLMQTKVGLITLVRNFQISLNKKTKTPLTLNRHGVLIAFDQQVWFDLEKL